MDPKKHWHLDYSTYPVAMANFTLKNVRDRKPTFVKKGDEFFVQGFENDYVTLGYGKKSFDFPYEMLAQHFEWPNKEHAGKEKPADPKNSPEAKYERMIDTLRPIVKKGTIAGIKKFEVIMMNDYVKRLKTEKAPNAELQKKADDVVAAVEKIAADYKANESEEDAADDAIDFNKLDEAYTFVKSADTRSRVAYSFENKAGQEVIVHFKNNSGDAVFKPGEKVEIEFLTRETHTGMTHAGDPLAVLATVQAIVEAFIKEFKNQTGTDNVVLTWESPAKEGRKKEKTKGTTTRWRVYQRMLKTVAARYPNWTSRDYGSVTMFGPRESLPESITEATAMKKTKVAGLEYSRKRDKDGDVQLRFVHAPSGKVVLDTVKMADHIGDEDAFIAAFEKAFHGVDMAQSEDKLDKDAAHEAMMKIKNGYEGVMEKNPHREGFTGPTRMLVKRGENAQKYFDERHKRIGDTAAKKDARVKEKASFKDVPAPGLPAGLRFEKNGHDEYRVTHASSGLLAAEFVGVDNTPAEFAKVVADHFRRSPGIKWTLDKDSVTAQIQKVGEKAMRDWHNELYEKHLKRWTDPKAKSDSYSAVASMHSGGAKAYTIRA